MKNIITSSVVRTVAIVFAGALFSVSIFSIPAHAGLLDGNFDCFPFPICDSGGSSHNTRRNQDQIRISGYVTQRPATIHATPTPTPQPVQVPVVTNTNTNTNTIYVNGGGSYPVYVNTPSYPTYTPSYDYYNNYPTYPTYYPQPQYQYQTVAPVTVSCSANTTYTSVGQQVVWRAFVSGGYGYYSYSWSGSDGFYGINQSAPMVYQYPGQKTAYVTVTSGGVTASSYCPSITIGGPVYAAPIPVYQPAPQYPVQNAPSLDIACYATPTKAKIGQAVTWTADVQSVYGPVRVTWSGTDGLTNNGSGASSVTKYYTTPGTKKATVTVTAANGISSTRACGVTVSVASNVVKRPTVAPVYENPQVNEPTVTPVSQTSAAFFSLANVPWGWVAFLVILILFISVIYLLFNRLKI